MKTNRELKVYKSLVRTEKALNRADVQFGQSLRWPQLLHDSFLGTKIIFPILEICIII